MPYQLDPDLIWIREVKTEYDRSADWVYDKLKNGGLTQYKIDGDKKTYLSRREIEQVLKPRAVDLSQR